MNILGISGMHNSVAFKRATYPNLENKYYHIAQGFNSAATLIIDNKIIAAAEEERFTREKATGSFPTNAVQFCLQYSNLDISQIDYIAHGFNYEPYAHDYYQDAIKTKLFEEVYSRKTQLKLLHEELDWPSERDENFIQVPHHLAHAASCYYLSGFKKALILIVDGVGENEGMTIAVGENNNINILSQISGIHSIGILYSVFTMYLGFEFGADEYKVMGLAPYGNPNKYFNSVMELVKLRDNGKFTIPILYENYNDLERETYLGTLNCIEKVLGPSRKFNEEITVRHQDIAAAIQVVLQVVLMHVLLYYKQVTGLNNLVMAGGVALNCTANSYIKKSHIFSNIFIQPAAGDDGSSLGAALYTYYQRAINPQPFPKLRVPYYGPSFDSREINILKQDYQNYEFNYMDDDNQLYSYVAEQIANGQIIGWFQGRMEFGPRALGNRSILADPRDPTMKDKLNSRIKLREGFRPFAPVVTMEAALQIFEIEERYLEDYMNMLLTAQVRAEYKNMLPAITHVDGSARLQTVSKEDNPRYWSLIDKFGQLTGIAIIINTSFNIKGQPIVCTIKDALETLALANLDLLVIDNWLITRK